MSLKIRIRRIVMHIGLSSSSMLPDRYGLKLSTASAAARDAYVAGCDCLLSANAGGEMYLQAAVAADPEFALAHAALARAYFVVAKVAEARASAATARALAPSASPREQGHVHALCLAIEGKPVDALAATRAHLAGHPRDAMVLAPATGVFGLIGFSGRQEREPEQVALLEPLLAHLGEDWWFQCVYAFALEEVGRIEEARGWIERSMAANPRNAHGAHIKAHVHYEAGEERAAADYLDTWMPEYPKESLLHCHLSWHVAMFALSLGDMDKAWRVYRAQVHPAGGSWGPALNSVTDSTSFLWRAELAGEARVDLLWREAGDFASASFPKTGISFVDVHASLSRVAMGQGVDSLVRELRERDAAGKLPAGSVVYRLAEGLAAFARGDWTGTIRILEAALPDTVRIGGSRAQRDLIEYTLLAAYLKDGRAAEAKKLIAGRGHRRPAVPVQGYAQP